MMNNEKLKRRVYIKFPVINTNVITKLQKHLISETKADKITLIPEEKLHVTLFHYGRPVELYDEVKEVNTKTSRENFFEDFYKLLMNLSRLKAGPELIVNTTELGISKIRPMTEALDMFGDSSKPVIVLRLKKEKELLKLRESIFKQFKRFLKTCGIKDTTKFMENSPNLKYQVNYNPHISIGFIDHMNSKLLATDVSDIQILLGDFEIIS